MTALLHTFRSWSWQFFEQWYFTR